MSRAGHVSYVQLCDQFGAGSVQCLNYAGCAGSVDNNCNPFDLWTGTFYGDGKYYYNYFAHGSTSMGPGINTYAFSVRCVLWMLCKQLNSK